ncbi:MAG: hypothetical protein JW882_18825 [Deltaproteobacteria bacterium]|nr:hypothetical protein [Deltaproteobacteria bacterium]
MKFVMIVIFTCILIAPLCSGCSKEEPFQNSDQVTVIKQAIPQKPKIDSESLVNKEEPQKAAAMQKEDVLADANKERDLKVTEKQDISEEEEKGYYTVRKGESLRDVAGKMDILGDPLKWPVLFRMNMDEMAKLGHDKNLPSKELPEGMRLKINTSEEQKRLLKSRENSPWVINVLSSQNDEKIVMNALRLIKFGYPVYISRAKIKGEEWMRLRVGFFNKKVEAEKEGNNIMDQLGLPDIWTTKIETGELDEFAKY